jgi:hypothetical protein
MTNKEQVSKDQIEFFLGSDDLKNACLEELQALANGTYTPKQFKRDILNYNFLNNEEDTQYEGYVRTLR